MRCFSKSEIFGTRLPDCSYSDPIKCVFGPSDVWVCPRIYRFILKSVNAGQTISDPPQKLIVYTLPSIWQYTFFQNDIKIPVFCQNRGINKIGFVLYCIAYWYCLLAPVIPLWKNSICYSLLYCLC